MIDWDDIEVCDGCGGQFDVADLDDNLCEACAYEHGAKLDAMTEEL